MWMLLSDAPPIASGLNIGLLLLVSAGAVVMSGVLSTFGAGEVEAEHADPIDNGGIGDDRDDNLVWHDTTADVQNVA